MVRAEIWSVRSLMKIMSLKRLIYIALFEAIMIVLTCVVVIPIGSFGYINLSDLLIMLLSSVFGWGELIMIGGVGCALADLFLGYSSYAVFTLFIKSIEAVVIFFFVKRLQKRYRFIAYIIGSIFMLIGYGISDVILSASPAIFVASFVANCPQAFICTLTAVFINVPFERFVARKVNETK